MPLNAAHEGYEYQDLLTAYFILKEILNEKDSSFKIDTKEYPEDKIDDLTIENSYGVFKKQIKYSNEKTNQQLQKQYLSGQSTYQLHLDSLFYSWNNHPNKNKCEVRICLAWREPEDDLTQIFIKKSAISSFISHNTNTFQIDINKLWPKNRKPIKSWKRFRIKSSQINRNDFENFCKHLIIETGFPKQSPNTTFSGELENIVLDQIYKIGIGDFPNDETSPKAFALELMHLIRRSRSRGFEIKTQDIFKELNIQTDYGAIEQVFPIDEHRNIKTEDAISEIKTIIISENRILLIGEPGSGKSWFIQNLSIELQNENYTIVKHYCYTELKDKHIKDRIQLNVFFGNLINDILNVFPDLKVKKQQKYASNLKELNKLLQEIDRDTILIIDGLDHIDRIFEFSQSNLTLSEIQIINAITQLQPSDKVKIFVISQPIQKLNQLSNYTRIEIPLWKIKEVKAYFNKNNISDIQISNDTNLSNYLLEKSNGNPLYLNYLTEEIKKFSSISATKLNLLPPYSYNLKEYYHYLLKKLDFDAIVPQVLSGANFSLSKNELTEITKQGKKVEKAIITLSAVLKENISTGGFIIYHESFRRFIIEKLIEDQVDIDSAIFKPLIDWFENKGFFSFPKANRFYFQLLYENAIYDKILLYLNKEFITKSVYHGHSFDVIKNNYKYLANSALKLKNFPKIILANEINKTLSSTEEVYREEFTLYLSALGYLKGFKVIADHLVFEGKPALPLHLGLEACYLCSQNMEPAPWGLYYEYFKENQSIPLSEFKYYIRSLLLFKDTNALIKIAEQIIPDYPQYIISFRIELTEFHNIEYINELTNKSPIFDKVLDIQTTRKTITNSDILSLSNELLSKVDLYDDDLPLLNSFFKQIEFHTTDTEIIEQVIKIFRGKNWFYNWIIYYIKIKVLQVKKDVQYFEIKEAFQFLIYDTEPFKGEPRTCDLYKAESFIYNSIVEGLKFIKADKEWIEIIDILIELSENTTTELRKSFGGPLTIDKLFQILDENSNDNNRKKIIKEFEKLISEKEHYNLHSYVAEYHFRLSKQYSIQKQNHEAESSYYKGIKFLLGYTSWKDSTLADLISGVDKINKLNNNLALSYIKNVKSLVDSVTYHTSGKGTSHFPREWFQKILKINYNDATKYLLKRLLETQYSWVCEEQLQDLLITSNGKINELIELFIYRTFPIEASEGFLTYGLTLVEKNKEIDYDLSRQLLASLFVRSKNRRNDGFSKDFTQQLNQLLNLFGLNEFELSVKLPTKKEYHKDTNTIELIKVNSISRKQFSDMTIQEQIEYFSNHKIKETDLASLFYYFDSIDILTQEIQELIQTIVEKNEEYPKNENLDLTVVFEKDNDVSAYYWICRFVHERDGWYRHFINVSAFKKACYINQELAIDTLIKLSNNLSKIGFNYSFSSNLINALIEINFQADIIEEMMRELYNATEFRLPVVNEIVWEDILSNNLNMDIEEIFICILFTRFKSCATERHHWTISGLYYLYQHYPEKMIKPTKWFFNNNGHFIKSNLIVILEILYDINKTNIEYYKNFKEELNGMFPSNIYIIDILLEKLLSKSRKTVIKPTPLQYTVSQNSIDFFKNYNYRNNILYNLDFNLESVVAKYKSSFQDKYKDELDILFNRSIETYVKYIYPSDYLIELINGEFYDQFSQYPDQKELYEILMIDYKTILSQINSYNLRPIELPKPQTINEKWNQSEVKITEWIRLAYCEFQLFEERHGKNIQYRIYEGIIFDENVSETIPFSRYRLFPIHIWLNIGYTGFDEFMCLSLIQNYDYFEDYRVLWLNPIVIDKLKLNTQDPMNGLKAANSKGDVVLKYNRWISDYVGNGDIAGISDEIPRLEGAELLCRKDYYEKICEFYNGKKPFSYRLKI